MKKNRFIPILLLVLSIGFVLTMCKKEVEVNKITIDQSSLVLRVKQTVQLTAVIDPIESEAVVEWASSNSEIATVSSTGLVTAVAEGKTQIVATAGGKTATCAVLVGKVEKLDIRPDSIVLAKDETETLKVSITPRELSEKTDIAWSSKNPEIVSVNNKGKITAKAVGETEIYAKADGKVGTCMVKVVATRVLVTNIKLSKSTTSLMIGEKDSLEVTITPANATTKTYTWQNSDPTVAKVNQNGIVTALKAGTTMLKVVANDKSGKSDSCQVTVVPLAPKEIVITPASGYIAEINGTLQLEAEVLPAALADSSKRVVWRVPEAYKTILSVSEDGEVTGLARGIGKVVATHKTISTISKECEITVNMPPVSSVSVSPTTWEGKKGETKQLTANVLPVDAGNKTVTWTSSNEAVATVSNSGLVTAKTIGTATITATSNNGKKGSCNVTITPQLVTSITLNKSSLEILINTTQTLTANVSPSNAENKTVTWTSSNTTVATVDQTGKVSAIKEGNATITAAATDGSGKKATCNVTVTIIPVTKITINRPNPVITNINVNVDAPEITIEPSNATYKTLTWTSSDPTAVAINSDGRIMAKKAARSVTITAAATDGSGVTASYTVNVFQQKIITKTKAYEGDIYLGNVKKQYSGVDELLHAIDNSRIYYRKGRDFYYATVKTLTASENVQECYYYGGSIYWMSPSFNYYLKETKLFSISKPSGYTYKDIIFNKSKFYTFFTYGTTQILVYKNSLQELNTEIGTVNDHRFVVDDSENVYAYNLQDTSFRLKRISGTVTTVLSINISPSDINTVKLHNGSFYIFSKNGVYKQGTKLNSIDCSRYSNICLFGENGDFFATYAGDIYLNGELVGARIENGELLHSVNGLGLEVVE